MENQNNKTENTNSNERGALWVKYNDKDVEYFSIKIEVDGVERHFKAFLNSEKTNSDKDKRPNFLIFDSKNIPKSNTQNN